MHIALRPLTLLVALLFATSAPAQTAAGNGAIVERYFAALDMGQVFDILRDEGIEGGRELARDDPDMTASTAWLARLERIYDTPRARDLFADALGETQELEQSSDALAFFETDLGTRIVASELKARRAMADEKTLEDASAQAADLGQDDPGRMELYTTFIAENELVESNVSGALNSNLAFYRGMSTQETYRDTFSEDFILSTVWEQEPEIRRETEDWTVNFATLAYADLSDAEMERYIDVSRSSSGRKLNAALFAGFNAIFEEQSFDLGRAMAEFSAGEDT